jgi:molecular chaperone DnaK (HSP70)
MDIGIDLGTTHSVLSVKGNVDLVAGYPEGEYIEKCGVTIIPSPEGDATFPSVLAADPDVPGGFLFGYDALATAQDGISPIMFSKRSIGTDQKLKLQSQEFTAMEVAAKFLGYLKQSAERALGRPVERAVVTHPAYFDPNQIQETKSAAEMAGLDMSLPEQLMMEPAAAALAYLNGVEKDPISVMTYDLGGGTFDVTVLERRDGVITMKAFDGNALLGGYNFDRALVQWMLDKVAGKGRNIPYDKDNPDDRGRRARLLMIAESVKIRLAEARTDRVSVPVRAPDVLVDEKGRLVPIHEKINRQEFADLIRDSLESTLECCQRAIAKAEVDPEDLAMVLLVGGSTYGPWVSATLSEAFEEVEVEEFEPDKCVAAGAAIQAANLPPLGRGHGLRMTLEVPASSALPSINIAGEVLTDDGSQIDDELRRELQVFITLPDGSVPDPCPLGENGRFLFERVDLEEDETNEFQVRIIDSEERQRLIHDFEVEHNDVGGPDAEIYTVLPKQLSIDTAKGLVPIAEEGVTLPAKIREVFTRLHNDPKMSVPLYLENEKVGSIEISDIPENAGQGSKVKLEVEITQKNEMRGVAKVFTRGGTEAARCDVRIVFPPLPLPDLSELLTEYEDLESERENDALTSQDPRRRTLLAGKGAKISKRIKKLFAEQEPDVQEIRQALQQFKQIIQPPIDDMDPPRSRFLNLADECGDLITGMGSNPEATAFEKRLQRISAEGEAAFVTKNHKRWARANENLQALFSKLNAMGTGGDESPELPPTDELKEYFLGELDKLRARLVDKRELIFSRTDYESILKPRCDAIDAKIDRMEREVEKVSDEAEPREGMNKLRRACRPMKTIDNEIHRIDKEME